MVLVVVVALLGGPFLAAAQEGTPGAGAANPRLYKAVVPEQRRAVMAETADRLSRYRIEATLRVAPAGQGSPAAGTAEETATLDGTEQVTFVNATGGELAEVSFRLFANAPPFYVAPGTAEAGGTEVRDVTVDGRPTTPEPSVGGSVLRVPLPAPVPPGGAAEIGLAFTTTVPTAAEGSPLHAFEPSTGTWVLPHWFPILAGFDPETGWAIDPFSPSGDPIFAEAALYDVRLIAPSGLVLVASGARVDVSRRGDEALHRFVTGPSRGFALVVDDDFASSSREVGGTTVTASFNPGHEAAGETVLAAGVAALARYNELFGPYPYDDLDLVETPFSAFGGVVASEQPQLVLMGGDFYGAAGQPAAPPEATAGVVAHEVAHQWWYGLVGNNPNRHAFIDEGMAELSRTLFLEGQFGPEVGAAYRADLRRGYEAFAAGAGDQVVDQPTDAFVPPEGYFPTAYGRAALGFLALRAEIGDDAFFAALRDYVDRERFRVAQPADLRAAFERAAGRDLGGFWGAWFETAGPLPSAPAAGPATAPVGTPAP
jgi:hypothetical protein